MSQRLSDEERKARRYAARDAWFAAHPNYRAEYAAKHRERDLPRKREAERARIVRLKTEADRRAKEVERVGDWAKANPEKRRDARERYKAKNPEAYQAQQRDYYLRNKEKIRERIQARESALGSDQMRERQRRYNATARAGGSAIWSPSQDQRERYLAQQREKKQIERRLKRSDLPPRRVRRTLVSERRASLTAAAHFFARERSREEARRLLEGDYSKRAAPDGGVAPELLKEWSELAKKIRQRGAFRHEVRAYVRKNDRQLREDISLDSRAREMSGQAPLDENVEIYNRARAAVHRATQPTELSESTSAATLNRAPQTAGRRRPEAGSSAPHVFPGGASSQGPRLH